MNTFDQLQELWRQQTVPAAPAPERIRAIEASATRVVNSRGRLLKWGTAITVFSILFSQLLMVVNVVQDGAYRPTGLSLTHFVAMQMFQVGLLVVLLRRLRSHRTRRDKSAATVAENTRTTLALIETEMRDYRVALRLFAILLIFDAVPILNGYGQGHFDADGALDRLLFMVVLGGTLIAVAVRHSRRVLQPQKQQLTELLRELGAA